jgi:hypothetical protein
LFAGLVGEWPGPQELLLQLADQAVLQEELANRGEEIGRQRAALREVTSLLVAQRITLVEAAAWFWELNWLLSDPRRAILAGFPGRSEGERLCRYVITRVAEDLADDGKPGEAAGVRERLERELQGLLEGEKPVCLPRGAELPLVVTSSR